jgi:hypothetical protein
MAKKYVRKMSEQLLIANTNILRQFGNKHCIATSKFSRDCDAELLLSVSSALSFPVAAYILLLLLLILFVFPSLLSFLQ